MCVYTEDNGLAVCIQVHRKKKNFLTLHSAEGKKKKRSASLVSTNFALRFLSSNTKAEI